MEYHGVDVSSLQWENYDILLPAVSVGHVGQLSIDLLISSLAAERVGRLDHPALYPVVGVDAYRPGQACAPGTLQTALEVYNCPAKRIVMLQQRSPCIPGSQREFCCHLVEWVKKCHFRSIVMLGSLDAQQRVDGDLYGDQLRFACTPDASVAHTSLVDLGWQAVGQQPGKEKLHIPGSGMARRLFTKCTEEHLKLSLVLWFSQLGCQVQDAIQLVRRLNQWLTLVEDKEAGGAEQSSGNGWNYPSSWKVFLPQDPEELMY